MKSSVIFLISSALLVSVVLGGFFEDVQSTAITCLTQTGADLGKLLMMLRGQQVVPDDKIKCFGACLLKSLGMMSGGGNVDKNAAAAKIPLNEPKRDQMIAAIDQCFDQRGTNECETAFAIMECLRTNHLQALPAFG
ncbi:general odorant-binding protein 56h [Fopius arisanus]|uniref:General odorant-binding protein 56h n=1 Tax=Fopius arisanus TaxID=64838 RepID=A0A9R1SU25_9HYME|nr:PREDICTED: general odorant-binding protein 56h [Fopius arisanus]